MNRDKKSLPPGVADMETSKKNGHFNGNLESRDDAPRNWFGRAWARRPRLPAIASTRLRPGEWLQDPPGSVNRLLLIIAALFTIAAVAYLLLLPANDAELLVAQLGQNAPSQGRPSQSPRAAGSHDKLFASRQFFRSGEQAAGPTEWATGSCAETDSPAA